jgi:predicted dinucleotide-binding enzyme
MKTKETIAIIGATGNMGSAIARNLAKHNYRLILMSRNSEDLSGLKHSLSTVNAKAVIDTNDCAKDVSWEADIIILACPYEAEREIAKRIREVAVGKIVISISNPLNARYSDLVSPHTSAAEELQKLLPDSKVVKAFNTTLAADFTSPVIDGNISDAFIAANNGNSLEVVSNIVADAGFNPVVAGDLSVSRTLERMLLKQIQIGLRNRYDWLAGWKIVAN